MKRIQILKSTGTRHLIFICCLLIFLTFIFCSCTALVQDTPDDLAVSSYDGISEDQALTQEHAFLITDVLPYRDSPYVTVHNNIPYFTEEELQSFQGEYYSEMDVYGRCGVCMAMLTAEMMPSENRGIIGDIRPSGWKTVKYDGIEGNYLYNRCHLIGWQLTGQNDNPNNLITGTRYLNVEGMEPFENRIASYLRNTDASVLYRVTPIFEGSNLLASGVLMEAESVNQDFAFCVYCYNVQPGISIDYATGDSTGPEYQQETKTHEQSVSSESKSAEPLDPNATYIGNQNSMKFHLPTCPSVTDMAAHNRVYFYHDREEPINAGYDPCGKCRP